MTAPFDTEWLFASVLLTTPILYAAVGELISQRAGVMNIGLEGMMLTGAFFAYVVAEKSGDIVLGLLAGVASGILLASVMAFLAVHLRADQIIVGVGLNILAFGYTAYLLAELYPAGDTPEIHQPGQVAVPLLSAIPVLGKALFKQDLLVYGTYVLTPLAWIVLYRTRFGLGLRAGGELPAAAESAGVSAVRVRTIGVLTAGALAALGGAYLSIGDLGLFRDQMTAGRGFLAFAAVIFGGWRPLGVLAACTLFGMSDALQLRLQTYSALPRPVWLVAGVLALAYVVWVVRSGPGVAALRRSGLVGAVGVAGAAALFVLAPAWTFPTQLWLALPYILTLLALGGFVGRARAPRALGIPYDRLRS